MTLLLFKECLCLLRQSLWPLPVQLTALSIIRLSSSISGTPAKQQQQQLTVSGKAYPRDDYTNVTERILERLGRQLHKQPGHPLCLLTNRIISHVNATYTRSRSRPLFTVVDNLSPVVSVEQNFDSLLIPPGHVSRQPSDVYYLNRTHLLRGHTSAHQCDLLRQGLDAFLVIGDVYRRDEIDRTHFPVFHQMEGVRVYSREQLFAGARDHADTLRLFDSGMGRCEERQAGHSIETGKQLEHELKSFIEGLVRRLFGDSVQHRWVPAYFPFTHPSWELEIRRSGGDENEEGDAANTWLEMLGCGLVEQRLLDSCGLTDRVGWAFGLGLERWAMRLFRVPDIRLFWSSDPAFVAQFQDKCGGDLWQNIVYRPISVYPPCPFDISFWLPTAGGGNYHGNDFYDLVRSVAGDLVEQVNLQDDFVHPKSGRRSLCYRIVYRSHERTLTAEEVRRLHADVVAAVERQLGVEVRL